MHAKISSEAVFANVLGASSAMLYLALCQIQDWHTSIHSVLLLFTSLGVLHLVACLKFRANSNKWILKTLLVWALIFRVLILADSPERNGLLSTDVYRYLWEGVLIAENENPYLLPPNSEQLAVYREEHQALWDKVDHKQVPTIYPPLAQYFFALFAPDLRLLKVAFTFAEFLSIGVLLLWLRKKKFPMGRIVLYAWLPLSVVEISSSAHLEGLLMLWILLGLFAAEHFRASTVKRNIVSTVFLTAGALTKFVAVVPLGFLQFENLRSKNLKMLAAAVAIFLAAFTVAYLPFTADGTLPISGVKTYAAKWEFNGTLYVPFSNLLTHLTKLATGSEYLLGTHASKLAKPLLAAVCLAVFLLLAVKRTAVPRATIITFLVVLICSPVVYPWYLLWTAPLLCICTPRRGELWLIVFFSSSLLSYEVLSHPANWQLSVQIKTLEYLPLAVALFTWVPTWGGKVSVDGGD